MVQIPYGELAIQDYFNEAGFKENRRLLWQSALAPEHNIRNEESIKLSCHWHTEIKPRILHVSKFHDKR